ncbi:MAG: FkbM family methyltransferase [Actinomycetota bacterium]|nr:FkbM family methyltransferase [Actinomycetota bacterium]
MISYAQNAEDVILARALERDRPGFYVDVGAASPTEATVTRHFYETGWSGINLEPVPKWAAALRALRPRDLTIEAAAGASPGELVFYEVLDDPALSTSDASAASRLVREGHELRELSMRVVTLDAVLAEAAPETIDFLKIDVEGAEREVLEGIDLARWRPRVITVEATEPNSLRPAYRTWEHLVTGRGYAYAATDGINRYYVREEEAALGELLVPANSLDEYVPMREQLLLDEIERLRTYAHSLELGRAELADDLAQAKGEIDALERRARLGRRHGAAGGRPDRPALPTSPPIERIAVLSTPGTGAPAFAAALARELGCGEAAAEHPADLRFSELPERLVVQLAWPRSSLWRSQLVAHGFQVVTIGRHPFDALLAMLRLVQVEPAASQWLEASDAEALEGLRPTSEAFVAWATSERAGLLVSISAGWWLDPGCWNVRFDELARDLDAVVGRAASLFRPGRPATARSRGAELGLESVPGGWRRYLTAEVAAALGSAHAGALATFGFGEEATADLPSAAAADAAWRELADA